MTHGKEDRGEVMTFAVRGRVDGKDKTMIFPIANVVGMTQILALHSLDTPSGGEVDHALMERMEVVVVDCNPHCSMGKTKQ